MLGGGGTRSNHGREHVVAAVVGVGVVVAIIPSGDGAADDWDLLAAASFKQELQHVLAK